MSATSKLVVRCLTVSLDGFAAGPGQSLERPMGEHVDGLHDWMFATRTGAAMLGGDGGEDNADEPYAAASFAGIGAWILGRNMFTPSRGPWTDDGWPGWWGPDPVYHAPVFVLTHHPREPLVMAGGTTFHFVTGGIHEALAAARAAAGDQDVRLVGGAATVRQYLQARLVDELHLVMAPILIGRGARVLDDLDAPTGYECVEHVATPAVVHLRFRRTAAPTPAQVHSQLR